MTIHATSGSEAAKLVLAGVAALLARHSIAWWVDFGPNTASDVKVMARIPDDLSVDYAELLEAYLAIPLVPQETGRKSREG